jgi:[acyl-carrier-protein] S-malonyltransferase
MSSFAFIFPGQGSQTVGMGQKLADAYPIARETFAEADDVLGFRLSHLCFEGPGPELTETRNAQPAILVTSIAALRALQVERPELPEATCLAGHSLGEYSALVAGGALAFAAAVRLTRARGELMARAGAANPGSMAAILKLDDAHVAGICAEAAAASGEVVQVANYNSPGQVVISGSQAGVAAAGERVRAAGGRVMPLAVSIAAHSALMASAVQDFMAEVAATAFAAPTATIYGNVEAEPLTRIEAIRKELTAQLTAPVRWTESVRNMAAAGVTHFVEVGPSAVLTGLVRRIDAALATANVAEPADIAKLEV